MIKRLFNSKKVALTSWVVVLATTFILPHIALASPYLYPDIKAGVDYYEATFPRGLIYSEGWYGTFEYAPPASEIILFDDDWTTDFGRVIFSMPVGISPHGNQGGTILIPISQKQADSIVTSYSLDASVKPFSAEIQQVMPMDAYFTGVWAGDKLKQKWGYSTLGERPPPDKLTALQKQYIADTDNKAIKPVDLTKYDPDRYRVLNGGVTSNWSETAYWSASSNGTGGASIPTNADNTFFNQYSFAYPVNSTGTVKIGASSNTLSMNWTGVTNTPAITWTTDCVLAIFGNVILTGITIPNVTSTGRQIDFSGSQNLLTTNGVSIGAYILIDSTLSLTDGLTQTGINSGIQVRSGGTLNTNNNPITTTGGLYGGASGTHTYNLGSSNITVTSDVLYGWFFATGTNIFNANTANIILQGTTHFGGGSHNYNGATLKLTGTAHTITGSNTFGLNFGPAGAQTITFTDGTTQTVTSSSRTGTGIITLQGSGTAGWNLVKTGGGTISLSNMSISRSAATPSSTWYSTNSTNGLNNSGWIFRIPTVEIE